MFENGSLLRRRKRFKLHKPDKDLLKSELQALASAMPPPPPPRIEQSPSAAAPAAPGNSLNAANLHRLHEDFLRWEQQSQMMLTAAAVAAATSNAGSNLRFSAAASRGPADWPVVPEGSPELPGNPYEALLHPRSWGTFSASGYVPRLAIAPYAQHPAPASPSPSSSAAAERLCEQGSAPSTELFDRAYESFLGYYSSCERACASEESPSSSSAASSANASNASRCPESPSPSPSVFFPGEGYDVARCPRNYSPPGAAELLGGATSLLLRPAKELGKKAKKPFTIENIIAPDEEEEEGVEGGGRKKEEDDVAERKSFTVPRPIYASGYGLAGVTALSTLTRIQRPPYRAAS